ncbi:MAG: ECF transporter S component, partial [Chloroflexota bacterium]
GLLAGFIALRRPSWLVPAWIAGVLWMMAGYFVGELALFGAGQAVADLVGTNWLQALAGVLGIALYYAVRAAYPPITQLRQGRTWREI